METARKALSRGPPCSPPQVCKERRVFTAEPGQVFADTCVWCGQEGERGLHPVQQTCPTHPSSRHAVTSDAVPTATTKAGLGMKHPSDAEEAGDVSVGLWRYCGHGTGPVVGQQKCPQES